MSTAIFLIGGGFAHATSSIDNFVSSHCQGELSGGHSTEERDCYTRGVEALQHPRETLSVDDPDVDPEGGLLRFTF